MPPVYGAMNKNKARMKKSTLLCLAALAACAILNAQEIKPVQASFEDYISLLNAKGYEAYTYDISALKEDTYKLKFEIREYVSGMETEKRQMNNRFKNRTMVKEFMWRELSKEELESIRKESCDFENGIYKVAEKVCVGFLPQPDDTTLTSRITIDSQGSFAINLHLRPIESPLHEQPVCKYLTRPFKTSSFEEGKFIPLVLCCSFWYDSRYNVIRCCGEKDIDPEMTADILKDSPHYYVIGMTCERKE